MSRSIKRKRGGKNVGEIEIDRRAEESKGGGVLQWNRGGQHCAAWASAAKGEEQRKRERKREKNKSDAISCVIATLPSLSLSLSSLLSSAVWISVRRGHTHARTHTHTYFTGQHQKRSERVQRERVERRTILPVLLSASVWVSAAAAAALTSAMSLSPNHEER